VGNLKATADGIRIRWWHNKKKRKRRRAEKEAWNAGADYIRRGWEIAWNQLTDARFLERYTTTQRVYICDGGAGSPMQLVPDDNIDGCFMRHNNPCNPCRWENRTVTRQRWVNTPSDGLIKKGSAIGELSKWNGRTVELEGVNHLEMSVHARVDRLFRDAFNGRHGGFFTTARR